jgi:hypothetical protein
LADGIAVILRCWLEDGAQVLVELSEVLVDLRCNLFSGGGGPWYAGGGVGGVGGGAVDGAWLVTDLFSGELWNWSCVELLKASCGIGIFGGVAGEQGGECGIQFVSSIEISLSSLLVMS